ncbi:glutamyl-tRNA reductase [Epidermidibacterium keratini]|uniref:Glutamyl-tRNA reductase n=1 Tax=Epidermidibacterium keratini TaxID=1891644 RepID=A0A7L4YKL9_9ACTN|nr:glutamyl-tRNA reductase [Epidermidibacterium keratini]QHB99790.1 glutamyl-tRNA reductase [Epidermidibacterium keratini]
MSYIVLSLSHHQAPIELLERAAITPSELDGALETILGAEPVNEAMVLSTCNRVEVYAHVEKFHAGLDALAEWLGERLEVDATTLASWVQVEYAEDAIEHMMRVASGLESMVVGEPQILGQLRTAYLEAGDRDAVGRGLHALAQHALRVGKRVQSDLGLAEAGRNLAQVAVELADRDAGGLAGRRALVVGAGAMATLAANALRSYGVGQIDVLNRSLSRAQALAAKVEATAREFDELDDALREADIVVTALGSSGGVIDVAQLSGAGETTVVDLALPGNVTGEAAALPQVQHIGLGEIRDRAGELDLAIDGAGADQIIAEEVGAFLTKQRSASVAPTIAALRERAREVIEAEVRRLKNRIPDVDDRAMGEIEYTIDRIVDKMLHAPSVKVRESAGTPGGEAYAEALRMLFELNTAESSATGAVAGEVRKSVSKLRGEG